MREIEKRLIQRNAAKQAINFESTSLNSEGHALWVKVTAWVMAAVMYLSPALFLANEVAHAAPIVDPRAPITFQPSVTQTSTGVPAINIPAANSNGISVGQYQSFEVMGAGLVLNNSLDSSFKCNTWNEVGCCDEGIQAPERRRARGHHDREGQKHERQGDCEIAGTQRFDHHAGAGAQSHGIAVQL
ncbi:filamentous hemagglutinin N-terminal domain-containing protein [Burkholderia ubonensis]|uniref:filamentous hemagglutinin N-terminal domain-containing protein n=1 Tax=Burkholderia ubonensis TaxID=101571 RepID=UPI001E4E4308|nr:filamentous hemagglutinin N-terminal domain-containing protein [Burkholderia ubonensis]